LFWEHDDSFRFGQSNRKLADAHMLNKAWTALANTSSASHLLAKLAAHQLHLLPKTAKVTGALMPYTTILSLASLAYPNHDTVGRSAANGPSLTFKPPAMTRSISNSKAIKRGS
jgi:hypothetical protein